jgi:hypothetical protein
MHWTRAQRPLQIRGMQAYTTLMRREYDRGRLRGHATAPTSQRVPYPGDHFRQNAGTVPTATRGRIFVAAVIASARSNPLKPPFRFPQLGQHSTVCCPARPDRARPKLCRLLVWWYAGLRRHVHSCLFCGNVGSDKV